MTKKYCPPVVLCSTASPEEASLSLEDGEVIPVGSPAWTTWLEKNSSFRFESGYAGKNSFTAKKHFRPTGEFWYALRKLDKKLRTVYLGRSETLTVERLTEAADKLINPLTKPKKLVKSNDQPQWATNELGTAPATLPAALKEEVLTLIRLELAQGLAEVEQRLGKPRP